MLQANGIPQFRKESQNFLKFKIEDVQNASDDTIEEVALEYLNMGAGPKHFSWDAALVCSSLSLSSTAS